ncbi:hypothetical protein J4439_06870 [Candidatus Woesearchaeota archaeon]|nr:hypothetical protein [Candidatus Woesearchaeota archaeon]
MDGSTTHLLDDYVAALNLRQQVRFAMLCRCNIERGCGQESWRTLRRNAGNLPRDRMPQTVK